MVSRLRSGDPTHVGRYEVQGRIGGGGMGMVYLAEGPRGTVALKLVRPELGDDPHFRARFRREVQASFRVSGVCTVRLLDFDTEAEQPWMATEYVDGPSLTELIEAGGPLPPTKQLALAVGLAEGLKSIHDEDVVHRDLKPSNVLCAVTGPKVIDFGIAAAADAAPITRSGLMVGSPGWLSPEQITTGRASAASDIFAWGCVLAYAAGGEQPFGTGTAEALFYRVLNQGPTIDFDKLHPALHDLVRQATAQDPAQRPSARALLEALLDVGAVTGDVRGSTGSSVTSVLQRDWSLPSGLQFPRHDTDSGTGPTGVPASGPTGSSGSSGSSGGWTGAGASAGSVAASAPPNFSKPSGPPPPPYHQPASNQPPYHQTPSSPPPSSPPPPSAPMSAGPPPAPFAPRGPWTPPPTNQTPPPYSQPTAVGYTPPPGPGGYPPGPYPPQQGGGFGPPSYPAPTGPGPSRPSGRKPWLIPALVGGGVLALVTILVVVLVAGSGGSKPAPTRSPVVVAKDPNRTRSAEEIDALTRAAALQPADVPGSTLDSSEEPPGLLMPCNIKIQDFPDGGRKTGYDYKDNNSNYTDQRVSVSPDVTRATSFFARLKSQIAGCKNYVDGGRPVSISANDPNFAVGDQGIYVNEIKGSVYLSWGYMRKGTVVVLISTISDVDQRSSIERQLTAVSDRIKAADG